MVASFGGHKLVMLALLLVKTLLGLLRRRMLHVVLDVVQVLRLLLVVGKRNKLIVAGSIGWHANILVMLVLVVLMVVVQVLLLLLLLMFTLLRNLLLRHRRLVGQLL